MCNKIHRDQNFQEIPEEGEGVKLFNINKETGQVHPFICFPNGYDVDATGIVFWGRGDYITYSAEYGFCFFFGDIELEVKSKIKSDFSALRDPSAENQYLKIRYKKGLGSHIELLFTEDPIRIALCKEFTLHEDEIARGYHF